MRLARCSDLGRENITTPRTQLEADYRPNYRQYINIGPSRIEKKTMCLNERPPRYNHVIGDGKVLPVDSGTKDRTHLGVQYSRSTNNKHTYLLLLLLLQLGRRALRKAEV